MAVIGEVLLAKVREENPQLVKAHRQLLAIFLSDVMSTNDGNVDLVASAERSLKLEVTGSLAALSEQDRTVYLRGFIASVIETLLQVTHTYGLIEEVEEGGFFITNLGRRVLLHLLDSQKFIDAVAQAHTRLKAQVG
jgi:hypothetical protein